MGCQAPHDNLGSSETLKRVGHRIRHERSGLLDIRPAHLMEAVGQKRVGVRDDSRDTCSVPLRKAPSPQQYPAFAARKDLRVLIDGYQALNRQRDLVHSGTKSRTSYAVVRTVEMPLQCESAIRMGFSHQIQAAEEEIQEAHGLGASPPSLSISPIHRNSGVFPFPESGLAPFPELRYGHH